MTRLTEIRDELLAQHEGLRRHLDAVRLAGERWTQGDGSRARVCAELAELADALRNHNLHEERVLRELVRSVDAWGPARVGVLENEHVSEHREIFDTLVRVSQTWEAPEGTGELESFCRRMLAHMTSEEKAFLNAAVLRDDDLAIDVESG